MQPPLDMVALDDFTMLPTRLLNSSDSEKSSEDVTAGPAATTPVVVETVVWGSAANIFAGRLVVVEDEALTDLRCSLTSPEISASSNETSTKSVKSTTPKAIPRHKSDKEDHKVQTYRINGTQD